MSTLTATLIQTPLHWEDKNSNLAMFDQWLNRIDKPTDLIMLPEMFATGFSMDTSFADLPEGDTINWLLAHAQRLKTPICGSLMMRDTGGQFVNRFVWMTPDGKSFHYDKRHLFRMGNEHHHFAPGKERLIIDYKGWKLFPVVCYDLRFPVWLRRTAEFNYDAMLIVANWPERREHHWRTLLQARAIENQSYVLAVNRVGLDGNGVNHSGYSGIVSPKGEWLLEMNKGEDIRTLDLSKTELTDWRTAFPAASDADLFSLL
jgi:predicted amidohydrolase